MRMWIMAAAAAICIGAAACSKQTAPSAATPEATPSPKPVPSPAMRAQSNPAAKIDACGLISAAEFEAIVGSPLQGTKASAQPGQEFATAQCFYTAAEFSRSATLAVMSPNPESTDLNGPRRFWEKTFGRYSNPQPKAEKQEEEKERQGEREEEHESHPPLKVEGLGDEAFWTSGFAGTLYVLRGDLFIRVGLGSADKDDLRLEKAKALAAKALEHL